jgi:type III restriction enzyme
VPVVKLQFDAYQPFQIDAVAAVVDLFAGQPRGEPEYAIHKTSSFGTLRAGLAHSELGVGNRLVLDADRLRANTRAVQARNDIEAVGQSAPLEAWDVFDVPANAARRCHHFSVEMETGTGKTYVYLRTIFELSRRYGFNKFLIVVPSVAIREGVLKNIDVTREHFRALFNNLPFEHMVYDGKRVAQLRQFATSTTLQILVINIDAFRKNVTGTGEAQQGNVIYEESERLSGRRPIEFVQAARPIVVIDEPQSVDGTALAQQAIKALNPLCTLRYSATHKNPYNLVYRLDPIRAFELRLVKQIVVGSATAPAGANDAFVRVEKIGYQHGIMATLRIHVQTPNGPREQSVVVKHGTDLFSVSEERAAYQQGFSVAEISAEPGQEFVRFSNGRALRPGEETGGPRDDVWRTQIRQTTQRHLEKELEVRGRGIKVLTLFFIDRVANYREYAAGGRPVPGKLAGTFEAELAILAKDDRFRDIDWLKLPFAKLHDGYFARDKRGFTDTRGDTQADDAVYDLIMKSKEQLLSLDEPLRFIFSHSALREGWDNPNVFQICNLRNTSSERERRQTLGRGLRLPVDQNGVRVFDEFVNRLYVMANETYEEYARGLQAEYEADCGVTFEKGQIERHIHRECDERTTTLKNEVQLGPEFLALWDRIKSRTTYRVEFEVDALVAQAVKAIRAMAKIESPIVHVTAARIAVDRAGVSATATAVSEERAVCAGGLPDILAYLENETRLTRSTLVRVLNGSGRLAEFFIDPQRFMDQIAGILKHELHRLVVDGIKYERISGDGADAAWEMRRFDSQELVTDLTAFDVAREDIRRLVKLPGWFTVDTPVGTCNPDWAILEQDTDTLYLVRERKVRSTSWRCATPTPTK